MTYQSVNPFDGKLLESFPEISDAALEAKLAVAAECYENWRRSSFDYRAKIAARVADLMRAQLEALARPITLEMGKLIEQSRGEVSLSADIIEYYANNAERFLATQVLSPENGEATIESSPIGVLFGVQPWNFPYYQLARFAAPNLMAGNVVMVKHAGCVPQCALAFEKLWLEAGAPLGAYTNLFLSYDQAGSVANSERNRKTVGGAAAWITMPGVPAAR